MFLYGKRKIELVEYTCSSARTKGKQLVQTISTFPSTMEVSSVRLSIAIARTILATNPTNFDLCVHSLTSYLNIQTMISSRSRELCLVDGYKNMFRDFSSSTKTGEIAQAISYLFAQDILGFPCVVDFEGYLKSQRLPIDIDRKRTPDFAVSKFGSSNITLLESKGSCPSKPSKANSGVKTALREALEQCDSGVDYLKKKHSSPVKNSYGVAVWFFEDSDVWNTSLHFADPDQEPRGEVENPIALIKYHYSTWFMLLGFFKEAIELVSGDNLSLEEPIETVDIAGESFYIFSDSYFHYYPHLYLGLDYLLYRFGRRDVRFGISTKIWRVLKSNNGEGIREITFKPVSEENLDIFVDGTIVMYR